METRNSSLLEAAAMGDFAASDPSIYQVLFDSLPSPAWVYDTGTLRFLEVNRAAILRYGYSRQEFLAMSIIDIMPQEDVARLLEFLAMPVEQQKLRTAAWRHRTKAGNVFEVEPDGNGLLFRGRPAMLVTIHDIRGRLQAENELRRAEESFRRLFDDAPVPYHEIDAEGVVVRVNRAECEVLGLEPGEILGHPVWDRVAPEQQETSRANVKKKLREGRPVPPFERTYTGRDGVKRTFQTHERLIYGPGGVVTGIRTAMLDLTEAKEYERKILFQAGLLDQVSDAIAAVDESFRVIYWNRAAEQLFGRSPQEVLGTDYGDAIQDALDTSSRIDLRNQFLEKGELRSELECRNRHGERLMIDLSAAVLRDGAGHVMGAVGIHRDMTERRRAEEALAASERRFHLAQSALGIGTWEIDLGSGLAFCSPETLKLYGLPQDRSTQFSHTEWLEHVHPQDRERVAKEFRSTVTKTLCQWEYRVVWPDGSVHWIFSKSNVIFNEAQQPKRIVGVIFDITTQKQRDEQLRILSSALEQSPVSIVITDPTGAIQYANPKVSEITGYTREELIGRNPRILKSGDKSAEEYRELWDTIPNGVWRGVFHNKKKGGESFWEAATIGPIRDETGQTTHYLAVKEDITERRAMEAALKFSEERFRVAAQSSGDVVYERDLASDEVQLFGCKDVMVPLDAEGRPVSGRGFTPFIHEEDRARVTAALQKSLETGDRYQEEYRIVFPSGEVRYWSDSAAALRDPSGKPRKWVGVVKDVTEAREAERANAELAAIVESTETAIFTRDLDATVLTWNAGAERLYGYTAAEIIGRNLSITVPPDRAHDLTDLNKRIRAGERVSHLETVRLSRDGTQLEVMMTVSPIFDRHEMVVGASHLVWDISEFRTLQRQLVQAQKLESVGQLAAGIAHEINTPIQYVGDNTEFLAGAFRDLSRFISLRPQVLEALRRGPTPELADSIEQTAREVDLEYLCDEVPKAIGQLSEGVAQVARIVRAMKEFSHPGTAEKILLNLNRSIESTILVSRNEWKYVADLTTDLDRNLPSVPGLGGELNQVILNLIVNAAHAIADVVAAGGQKGRILVTTRVNGKWAEIRVTDTGTGIPEAIRSKVFDPFFTTKEVGRGTGQGLSIAHNVIVKRHNGKLFFETECGVGTTFVVQLPLEAEATA